MVTHRFLVTLHENENMKQLLADRKLAIGCLDTWLLSKLTLGAIYVTEPSSSSSTGLFDPYQKDWGYTILKLIHFPTQILPEITDTAGKVIATSSPAIFGIPIQIGAMLGDQQAASFGCGCLRKGSVKICLGTGAFVDFHTGDSPLATMNGLYPLIGWRVDGETAFFAEGSSNDTSTILDWAKKIGLLDRIEDSSKIATEAESDRGLHFVPAFSGIQTPINDDNACCAFIGIRPETSKAQMVRAMLESIAFRIYQIWKTLLDDVNFEVGTVIRCCGGVSNNDFVCQTISTLLEHSLERVVEPQFVSAKGAALLAGITSGLWSMKLIENQIKIDQIFHPDPQEKHRLFLQFDQWRKASFRVNIRTNLNKVETRSLEFETLDTQFETIGEQPILFTYNQ
uniref:Glycerol kinase n=1 Tax=Acrobeloides nanus TaxID=290746 RepID=A0A914C733_9BILA